jgi:tetratricopeptide (TPR) repeat protein
MTEPEKPVTPEGADEATPPAEEPAPPPEPWTPERVLEWNRYYDLYVAAAVLLLVFVGSAHPIMNPTLWPDLQTGRLLRTQMRPVTTDPFSYTMEGRPWVNIPWLFQLASSALYDTASGGADPVTQPDGSAVGTLNREQLAAGLLVGLSALLRVGTALLLLTIRRPGPGLWWVALCAAAALGAMLMPLPGGSSPILPALGGIAAPAEVEPSAWGVFLLAIELVLLHRAIDRGRPGALWGLVPLFLVWANVDDSFLFGLLFLAAAVAGMLLTPRRKGDAGTRPAPAQLLGVLAACALVVLLNPSFARIYPVAISPLRRLLATSTDEVTVDQLSYFGRASQGYFDRLHGGEETGAHRLYIAYYILVVGVGLASFALNRNRFSWGRFLLFAVASVLWALLARLAPEFALVWAVTVALNGQEWYQDRFGREGHLGPGWSAWSVGGRAATLLVLSALILKGLTGYGSTLAEPPFGFGVPAENFAFEAADFLADARFDGNVLNLTPSTGDVMIWRAWPRNPERKTYIDGRPHLFPRSLRAELREIRRAFYADDKDAWQPLLDRYGVTVVLVPAPSPMVTDPNAPKVFESLSSSPDWIPFYDDGQVALFGRADAPEGDLAFFQERRLDAPQLAFHAERSIPSPERTPNPTGPLDRYFQNRANRNPQPHVWAAQRWLAFRRPPGEDRPDLAGCLLAIGELRTALAKNPDDPTAWRWLGSAYAQLNDREADVFVRAGVTTPPAEYRKFRLQQLLSVLNFAVQSSPPPRDQDARDAQADLHHQLGELYLSASAFDLARDEFEKQRRLARPGDFSPEEVSRLAQLDEQVERVQQALADAAASVEGQQANPLQRAEYAMSQGAPGIALQELSEAEQIGLSQGPAHAQLIDLYCQVGQADKAFELLGESGNVEDPALNTGPGTASYRQGLVYFLIGNYNFAALMWRDRAIRQLRDSQGMQALEATRSFLRGLVREAAQSIQELPGNVGNQAVWEAELGLCLLEAGKPAEAADHLAAALTLQPDSPSRPLLAHYLELLGREVPPLPEPEPAPDDSTPTPTPAPDAELPKDVFSRSQADAGP